MKKTLKESETNKKMSGTLICTGSWANGEPCPYKQKFEDRCGHHKRKGAEENQTEKCIAFLSNGEPCPHDKKIGSHCGKHAKKVNSLKVETEGQSREEEELKEDSEEDSKEEVESEDEEETDEEETDEEEADEEEEEKIPVNIKKMEYFLELGGTFKFGIETVNDDFVSERISETEYNTKSLEKDFEDRIVDREEDFHITKRPLLLKIKAAKSRYFIGISFMDIPLLIIPIFGKNDIIRQFYCVLYKNFELIQNKRTSFTGGLYPVQETEDIHKTIYGKRAEKGGWYKLEKNDSSNPVQALWITIISGRSKDQYDPNPNELNFYYYVNDDGINIKTSEPNNFVRFKKFPSINEGNPGDFYRHKNGTIFIKIDEHNIDHIGGNPLDAREHKLREITAKANAAHCSRKNANIYKGVRNVKHSTKYSASVRDGHKMYSKTFNTEIEAARFYDYHLLAIHGVYILNNNTLSKLQETDVLLRGFAAIPKKYKYVPRGNGYPVGIKPIKGTIRYKLVRQSKMLDKINLSYDTYEEAYKAWQEYENRLERLRQEKREQTLKDNAHNIKGNYGYLVFKHKGETYKVKLNLETFLEFIHCKWTLNKGGYPEGRYKKKKSQLHIHVFKFYNIQYNKKLHGTIDHRKGNKMDATIEFLRAASSSAQSQNKRSKGYLGYKGINIRGNSFVACYKGKKKTVEFLQDALREYNKWVTEDLGEEGTLHEIPEGQTRVSDFFGNIQTLSEDFINKSSCIQTGSIISANPALMKMLGIKSTIMLCKNNEKIFRQQVINYKRSLPVTSIKDMYTNGTMTFATLENSKLDEIRYVWSNDKSSGRTICKYVTDIKAGTYEDIKQKMIKLFFPNDI